MDNLNDMLKDITRLANFLRLAGIAKEMAFLDSEIASERDPENAWDKDDPSNAGKARNVYCWLVRLGPKMYLHTEGPIKLGGGGNLAHVSNDLDGVNRWDYEGASQMSELLRDARDQGGFTQITGKEQKDLLRDGINPEPWRYIDALLDRRQDLMQELKEMGIKDEENNIYTDPPRDMHEFLSRMESTNAKAEAHPEFKEMKEALEKMGIIHQPPDRSKLH